MLAAIVEEEVVAGAPDSSQGGGGVREGQRGLEEAEEPEVAGVDEPLLGERVDPGGEVFVDSVDQQVVGVEVGRRSTITVSAYSRPSPHHCGTSRRLSWKWKWWGCSSPTVRVGWVWK